MDHENCRVFRELVITDGNTLQTCKDSKFKEQREYTTRETKEHIQQLAEQWNEKFKITKQEQDLRHKDLNERILGNTNRTMNSLLSLIHI